MKYQFQNKYSFVHQPKETPQNPSMTVVGQSYTIRELYDRFTNGIDDNQKTDPIFVPDSTHESPDFFRLSKLDLVEQDQIRAKHQFELDQLKEKVDSLISEANKQKQKPPPPPPQQEEVSLG